jgi:hypothetical protein
MKFITSLTILLTTLASSAYVQAKPTAPSASVFTMTNAGDGNEVLMYIRNTDDGTLDFIGAFATGKRLG